MPHGFRRERALFFLDGLYQLQEQFFHVVGFYAARRGFHGHRVLPKRLRLKPGGRQVRFESGPKPPAGLH